MITHRNAWVNAVGTVFHHPMSTTDRYLWTLPMFHANGWTFVWIVTAVGGVHVCLRKVDSAAVFELIAREQITMLCCAPAAPRSPRSNGVRVTFASHRPRKRPDKSL